MPIHDWTRLETAAFHDFQQSWLFCIKSALNSKLLPPGYFAHLERHMGHFHLDILTLSTPTPPPSNGHTSAPFSPAGGVAIATVPPKAARRLTAVPTRRSSIAIRSTDERRLVALLELASPANKDRAENVTAYVEKARTALDNRVHVVHLDLLPPTKFAPNGLGSAIWNAVNGDDYAYADDLPLAADSFRSGDAYELFANPLAVGSVLPELPLFLHADRYIDLPLEATYEMAFQSIAAGDREQLSNS